jgi:Leucine-rich repeat (LRR) protein
MKTCRLAGTVLLALFFLGGSIFAQDAIPAIERQALITLYNSTNGDMWANNSGWKTPPLDTDGFAMPGTEGTWYGVNVDTNLRSITLENNLLSGTIPAAISNLNRLIELDLSSNPESSL